MKRRDFLRLALIAPVPLAVALGSPLFRGETVASALTGSDVGAKHWRPGSPNSEYSGANASPLLTVKGTQLAPTPACFDDDDVTPAQTEGPYFTRNSPERTSLLESGMAGTKLLVSGFVVDTACQPIPQALLDFWQADDRGEYDNVGYRLRGHQFADDAGRYSLETIVPGLYTGRTRHIHVKVQAPSQPVLTTQLYFPGEPSNQRDGIFRRELLMEVQDAADGKLATFNFVLNV